jgi:hypothetical protein
LPRTGWKLVKAVKKKIIKSHRSMNMMSQGFFALPQLAQWCGLSVRFLRKALRDPLHPLPHFRVTKKTIIVKGADFEDWLANYSADRNEVDLVVSEVMKNFGIPSKRHQRKGNLRS